MKLKFALIALLAGSSLVAQAQGSDATPSRAEVKAEALKAKEARKAVASEKAALATKRAEAKAERAKVKADRAALKSKL
jgi:hypothetical protein